MDKIAYRLVLRAWQFLSVYSGKLRGQIFMLYSFDKDLTLIMAAAVQLIHCHLLVVTV